MPDTVAAGNVEIPPHLAGALLLAGMGVKLFPAILRDGKTQPATKDPWKIATSDEATLRDWAQRYALFGVACGPSGLCVVDVDSKNGKKGFESLAALPALPATLLVDTPSGGLHAYLRGVTKSKINFKEGIDIKSDGGFVVAPGGAKAGKQYTCRNGKELTIAPLPEWLAKDIGERKTAEPINVLPEIPLDLPSSIESAKDYLARHAPQSIEGQGGDATLYSVAARLKDFGLSRDKALELLSTEYNPRSCIPEWSEEELAQKVDNAYRYGTAVPGRDAPATLFGLNHPWKDYIAANIRMEDLPPRKWLVAPWLIRGFVSGIIGPGGLGKSTLITLQSIAIASDGIIPCGDKVAEGGAVWIHNIEDPSDELRKRLMAYSFGFHKRFDSFPHNIFVTSGREVRILLAATDTHGRRFIANTEVIAQIKSYIKERGIVLWVIDPLVQIHSLPENDNQAMAHLMSILQDIAEECNCAICVCHHTRKLGKDDSAGDAETARGASSFINACRVAYTIRTMEESEARSFGVELSKRPFYVRMDSAKNNLCPPADKASWFIKRSVVLPNGDNIGIYEATDPTYFAKERGLAAAHVCDEMEKSLGVKEEYPIKTVAELLMLIYDPSTGGPDTIQKATASVIGLFRTPVETKEAVFKIENRSIVRTAKTVDLLD